MKSGTQARVCIIGAGPSGITAAKHLLQVGHTNFVIYERGAEVGGTWVYSEDGGHSSVYETAHIISSKTLSQYHDFPMPDHYPDYPGHRLLKEYFQSYAQHFGVTPYIQFHTSVTHAEKQLDETWRITLDNGSVEAFDFLIVANGHHSDPRMPAYPGSFTGELMHSHYYRSPLPFKGKRVLVIGGGNSACDIVCDIARHASRAAISWRRGYYVIPKIIFGSPPDVVNERFAGLPRWIRKRTTKLVWYLVTGGNAPYGLPKPDHDILESHPLANSQLLYWLKHGDVVPRPDVARFEGQTVHFVDGTQEDYDVVIAATGYKITFPFFDPGFLNFTDHEIPLYLRVFSLAHPSLFFVGLVQPQGCLWPLSDSQAQLVANAIVGRYHLPADAPQRLQRELDERKKHFQQAVRHSLEIEYRPYMKALKADLPADAPSWKDAPLSTPVLEKS
jgi:hypothetical protein